MDGSVSSSENKTAISRVFALGAPLLILLCRGYAKKYRLFTFRHLSGRFQKDILMVALPPCIQNVIALSIFMIYQTIVEDYSAVFLAATHTAFAFFRLNKTLIGGFARSAGILIGNALGRHDRGDSPCPPPLPP